MMTTGKAIQITENVAPAAYAPGSRPAASPAPGGQPAAPSSAVPKSAVSSAVPGQGEPAASVAETGRMTPPASLEPNTPSSASSGAERPSAPNKAGDFAGNLANEMKQADSAQATTLNIQAPEHE